ncbi:hypothetical protein ABTO22_19535, partial [Acinetobacter baumannii]
PNVLETLLTELTISSLTQVSLLFTALIASKIDLKIGPLSGGIAGAGVDAGGGSLGSIGGGSEAEGG